MGLSLRRARVCLDCDSLSEEMVCPWCDRDDTIPIAGWFRPVDDSRLDAMRHPRAPAPAGRRWLLVVQHQQRDLYRVLRQALAGTAVQVLYERRVGQRRRTAAGPTAEERRRADRRQPRPSAVLYPQSAAPAEPERSDRSGAGGKALPVARPRRSQPTPV